MYFETSGETNTDKTIELVIKKAQELDIKHIVVASITGGTALKFIENGARIICVTHQVGHNNPGEDEMSSEMRETLRDNGCTILTTTQLLNGVDLALKNKFQGIYPAEIMKYTLRLFGNGIKVCTEIATMALDAGLVPYGEEIITVAGRSKGVDTAIVITPAYSHHFLDTKIHEIVCKPRDWE